MKWHQQPLSRDHSHWRRFEYFLSECKRSISPPSHFSLQQLLSNLNTQAQALTIFPLMHQAGTSYLVHTSVLTFSFDFTWEIPAWLLYIANNVRPLLGFWERMKKSEEFFLSYHFQSTICHIFFSFFRGHLH